MRKTTLRQILFYKLAPTIVIAILIVEILSFFSARYEINHSYDAQLIQNTNVLWVLTKEEMGETDSFAKKEFNGGFSANQLTLNDAVDDYANGRMFRIWKSQHLVMYSDTALPETVPKQHSGFTDIIYKGEGWRIYSHPVPGGDIAIEVGEKLDLREDFVLALLSDLGLPLLVLLPALAALLWLGINSGLNPVRTLVQQIRARSPDDLSSLEIDELPVDLIPLGSSINQLFIKLRRSLDSERRFADHVAHSLRTPLAGLKLQIQMLDYDAPEKKSDVVKGLLESNDRASHLVDRLLTAARISHQPVKYQRIVLYPLLASIIAGLGVLIDKKHLEFSLEGRELIEIRSDETLLQIMFSNIIENAVKFTPEHGKVSVSLSAASGGWTVSIEDTGPGIPEDQRNNAFDKFSRINNPVEDGTGLGLSIVADIAERLSVKVTLSTPAEHSGLIVQVHLPI